MPKKIYYGPQTEAAIANFSFAYSPVHPELLWSIAEVKQATARANQEAGVLDAQRADAIVEASREIGEGSFDQEQFPLPGLQGGAGTSIHMNLNEVIANRAEELLHRRKQTVSIHPNDHVNASQSTNDVNPTALRIVLIRLVRQLLEGLDGLEASFQHQAQEYANVPKLGRTHLQDAVPTTYGAVFSSYAAMVGRERQRVAATEELLYELNIGGTAIGNGLNAPPVYQEAVFRYLREITGIAALRPAENGMAATSNAGDIVHLSGVLTTMTSTLSKIATDLRILASGPRGGIGEIQLAALQPGSSIMPGKVNPVIPESVNQLYFMVGGRNLTIQQAAEAGNLELSVMFPILADSILDQLKACATVVPAFAQKAVKTLKVDVVRSRDHLERSTGYATALNPIIGYDVVSSAVKEAVATGMTLREVLLARQLISEADLDQILERIEAGETVEVPSKDDSDATSSDAGAVQSSKSRLPRQKRKK